MGTKQVILRILPLLTDPNVSLSCMFSILAAIICWQFSAFSYTCTYIGGGALCGFQCPEGNNRCGKQVAAAQAADQVRSTTKCRNG